MGIEELGVEGLGVRVWGSAVDILIVQIGFYKRVIGVSTELG